MMKNLFLLLLLFSIQTIFYAQESMLLPDKACINCTTTQDNSAVVDIQSTNKGMLIPRMTTAQRTAITAPAKGLLVFDNTTNGFWFYDGGAWVSLSGGGGSAQWTASGTDIYNANTGNVGIGTTNPDIKLQIEGGTNTSDTGGGFLQLGASNSHNVSFDANEIQARNNGAASILHIQPDGAGTLSLAGNSGKVGIGTTSPDSKLNIVGGTDANAVNGGFIINGELGGINLGIDNNEIQARDNGVASNLGLNYDGGNITMGGPTGTIRFRSGSGAAERMRVHDNGYIGIGTTDPLRILHAKVGPGTSVVARIESENANGSTIDFKDSNTTGNFLARIGGKGDGLTFIAGGSERMSIPSNGRVGIGIANPTAKFHVWENTSPATTSNALIGHFQRIDGGKDVSMGLYGYPDVNSITNTYIRNSGMLYMGSGAKNLQIVAANTTGSIRFHTGGFSSDATERMRIHDNGFVGIGETAPTAKLHVVNSQALNTAYFTNNYSGTGSKHSVRGKTTAAGLGSIYAVYGESEAGLFSANGFGVFGTVNAGNGTKYGVYGRASADTGTLYGIYGTALGGSTRYAGYFNGNLNYTGLLNGVSDKKFKEKIENLEGALYKIMQLKPKSYLYKKFKDFNFAKGKQFGFIAQELQKEFPEMVTQNVHVHLDENNETVDETKYLGISYISLIPILTKGIQEQQLLIESQNNKIDNQQTQLDEKDQQIANLTDRLSALETTVQQILDGQKGGTGEVHQLNKAASLLQNQPNPFNENTQIQYYIPEEAQKAQLQITTIDGRVLDNFPLQKGASSITLDAGQLAAGNYIYTLIIDGKIVSSKKMVLTK